MIEYRFTVTRASGHQINPTEITVHGPLGSTTAEMLAMVQALHPYSTVKAVTSAILPMERTFVPGSPLRAYDVRAHCPVNGRFLWTSFAEQVDTVLAKAAEIYPGATFHITPVV